MYPHLFSTITIQGLTLKNRITMAPLYLGYAGEGGTVGEMVLEHYRLMAKSGAALIVVENATVDHPAGSGSTRTLRADTDDNLDGLKRLAGTIKEQGALACLQINHAGRFAHATDQPVAPSAVNTFGRMPRELEKNEIDRIVDKFADAAARARTAGFDMVELHGGTGYLLAQFLSPRTNRRSDEYGGNLENRQAFCPGRPFPCQGGSGRHTGGIPVPGRRMDAGRVAVERVNVNSPQASTGGALPIFPSWAAPMSPSRCRKSWTDPKNKATCSTWPRLSVSRSTCRWSPPGGWPPAPLQSRPSRTAKPT
jgi:hypothetical protein